MKFEIIENTEGEIVVILTKKQSLNFNTYAQMFNVSRVGQNAVGNILLILEKTAKPINLN